MPPKKIKLDPNQKKLTFFTRPGEGKVIDQTQERETGPILIDQNEPMANDTRDENTPAATSSSSGTTTRNFQNRWLNLYPWLSFNGTLMFCEWCKQKKFDNTFTTGTDNFRTSTLTRHLDPFLLL